MGDVGKPSVVQPTLYEYGIQNERSDIRCHVAPHTRLIFVFRTAVALSLNLTKYRVASAYQPGVNYSTAKGYLVPPEDIPDLRIIRWSSQPWWESFNERDTTSAKGAKAVAVVEQLLRAGRFPLWLAHAKESGCLEVQYGGTDILVVGKWRIQVKCDYRAGRGADGCGSGNLFLQTAERNPLRRT